jgi:hypothetical protein
MTKRTGYVYEHKVSGNWTARVTLVDSRGRKRNIRRVAGSKTAAKALVREIIGNLEEKGEESIQTERLLFSEAVKAYRELKVKPAEYRGDRKIAGLRSSRTVSYRVDALLEHFGKMRLRSITLGEI